VKISDFTVDVSFKKEMQSDSDITFRMQPSQESKERVGKEGNMTVRNFNQTPEHVINGEMEYGSSRRERAGIFHHQIAYVQDTEYSRGKMVYHMHDENRKKTRTDCMG
jgi:hypothetical protein